MTDILDNKKSVDNIIINMNELRNDIDDVDEHEHDQWGCSSCEEMVEEGQKSHEHDTSFCNDCEEVATEAVSTFWNDVSITDIMDNAWSEYEEIKEEGAEEERDTQRQKVAAFSSMLYNLADFTKKWDETSVATFDHNALAIRNLLHPNRTDVAPSTEEVPLES
jgi:hypothetical protein